MAGHKKRLMKLIEAQLLLPKNVSCKHFVDLIWIFLAYFCADMSIQLTK
jgi:hypothetical protein